MPLSHVAATGRGGNTWTSPDGCLMFSAGQKLKVPGAQAPFINYVVSLAVVRGIHDAIRESAPVSYMYEPGIMMRSAQARKSGIILTPLWSCPPVPDAVL